MSGEKPLVIDNLNFRYHSRETLAIKNISLSVDAGQVFQLVNDTVRKHPLVIDDPGPSVQIANFSGANIEYLLTLWVADAAKMSKIYADIRLMLLHAFENAEIPLA